MRQNKVLCGIASFLVILAVATMPAFPADDPNQTKSGDQNEPSSSVPSLDQQAVAGTLEKVTEGTISVKTSDGDVKIFDISEEKKARINSMGLKKGDAAVVTLDQKKQIVAVTKLGGR